MRNAMRATMIILLGIGAAPLSVTAAETPDRAISAGLRVELLAAREAAWRAFFDDDPDRLEQLLGPELVAIQQHQEAWESRDKLISLARKIQKNRVRIMRLEFPRTEIRIYGDVAILYYTYVFETGVTGRSVTDSGRGTEIFVRRHGRWVDVGWHLDSGAFVRRNGEWTRVEPAERTNE